MQKFSPLVLLLLCGVLLGQKVQSVSAQGQAGVCPTTSTVTKTDGGTWEARTSPALHRSETAATVLDDKIYVAGGLAGASVFYTEITLSFAVYDPATDSWKDLAPIPMALHHVALASLNGQLFLTGGYTALDFIPNSKKGWRYDPKADSWTPIADLPMPRAAHNMIALGDKIYLV